MPLHTQIKKKNLISIIKTNNFYYFSELNIIKKYGFSTPEKLNPINLKTNNYLIVVPQEIKDDEIINNIDKKKVCIAQFNLKNVEILIKNNLIENKLINPLYLS